MRRLHKWLRVITPVAALCFTAVGCDDDDTDDVDDFFVVSVVPGDTQTNVATSASVVIRFNAPVDPASLGGNQVIMVDQSNAQILISVARDPVNTEFITITPVTPLSPNLTYGVALREKVSSTLQEQLVAPFAMTFSTGATLSNIPGFPPFLIPNPAPPNAGPPGTFTLTGQLVTPRSRHQAVLLQSLDVVVFGGLTGGRVAAGGAGTVLRTAEIYNRTTGTWRATIANNGQGMAYPRYGHTATLLDNGKVLIAGGGDERTIWDTAEIYDPLTDSFSPTAGLLADSRQYHTATRVGNGNVILAGGFSMSVVLTNFLGGSSNSALIANSIEVYDVPSGTFLRSSQTMRREKMYHTATLLPNGHLMFAGGYIMPFAATFWSPTTALCDVYKPDITTSAGEGGVLEPTGNLRTARMNHTATSYTSGNAQGLTLIMAGYETSPFNALLQSGEVYDPNIAINNGYFGDFALIAANLSQGRRAHSTTLLTKGNDAGKLLLVGGAVTAPSSQPIIPPAPPHVWPATEAHNCGQCAATITAERFNPFQIGQALLQPYRGIDITGGFDWTRDQTPAMAQTSMVGVPPNFTGNGGRYYHTATELPTGHVLIAGGWDCPFCGPVPPTFSGPETPLGTCELYNP